MGSLRNVPTAIVGASGRDSKCCTHFDVLGVPFGASSEEIRRAYRSSALLAHPDKGGCADRFRAVLLAFEVLSSDQQRRVYEQQLREAALAAKLPPSVINAVPIADQWPRSRTRSALRERANWRLERAIAQLPREERRSTLERLPVRVRASLLRHMDAHRAAQAPAVAAQTPTHATCVSNSPNCGARRDNSGDVEATRHRRQEACKERAKEQRAAERKLQGQGAPGRGIMRSGVKTVTYYATVMVDSLVLSTRPDANLDTMIGFHAALTRAKQYVLERTASAKEPHGRPQRAPLAAEAFIPEAVAVACDELGLEVEDLGLVFSACIGRARSYIGMTVCGRTCTALGHAIAQRDRLQAAMSEGWGAFRLAYAACRVEAVASRRPGRLKSTAGALDTLDRAWERFAPQRDKLATARQLRSKQRAVADERKVAAGQAREAIQQARDAWQARRAEERVLRAARLLERLIRCAARRRTCGTHQGRLAAATPGSVAALVGIAKAKGPSSGVKRKMAMQGATRSHELRQEAPKRCAKQGDATRPAGQGREQGKPLKSSLGLVNEFRRKDPCAQGVLPRPARGVVRGGGQPSETRSGTRQPELSHSRVAVAG